MSRTICVILAVAAAVLGCSQRFETREDLYREGMKLMDAGNPAGAVVFFKKALDRDQNYTESRFQLARAYSAVGKFAVAEKELRKVAMQGPRSREVQIELARSLVQQAKADEALRLVGDMLQHAPDAEAMEIAGLAHGVKGDFGAAAALLKKTLSLQPDRATTMMALARVEAARGNRGEAKRFLEAVLDKKPSDRAALALLADIQREEGDRTGAMATCERMLAQDPADLDARLRKGLLKADDGRYEEARTIASELIAAFPNRPEGHRLAGIVSLQTRDYAGAVSSFQKAVVVHRHVPTMFLLGLSLYHTNDLELALSHLQRALEIDPSYHRARVLLAAVHLRKQRVDAAVEEAQKVLREDERNAAACSLLGSAYLAKGMVAEALAQFNRALEIDPRAADVRIRKGLVSMRSGSLREAESELVKAVQIEPELIDSRIILASYYFRQREYGKAVDTLTAGLTGGPSDAVLYTLIAGAWLRQNELDRAVTTLQKARQANPAHRAPAFLLAQIHTIRGEHDDALRELRSVLSSSPHDVRALLGTAAIYESLGNDEEARRYYRKARETGAVEAAVAVAKYFVRKNDPGEAIDVLSDALDDYPSAALLYEQKAALYELQGDYRRAVKTLEAWEKVRPGAALPAIVNVYVRMNKPDEALDRLKREIRKDPGNMDLLAQECRLHSLLGRTQAAVATAEEMIRRSPQSAAGYRSLALARQAAGELDAAIQAIGRRTVADPADAVMIGTLQAAKGDDDAALGWYRKAQRMQPDNVQAVFHEGALLHRRGSRKEALAAYTRALALSDSHVPTLNNIAYLYAEDDRELQKALQFALQAYIASPADGSVLDTLGFVLLKHKRADEAVAVLSRAVKHRPDAPSAYYHLALAYRDQGNRSLSADALRKALEFKKFPEARAARLLLADMTRQ